MGNNQWNVKFTYGIEENICKPYIDKKLIFIIYKKPLQLNSKKLITGLKNWLRS